MDQDFVKILVFRRDCSEFHGDPREATFLKSEYYLFQFRRFREVDRGLAWVP